MLKKTFIFSLFGLVIFISLFLLNFLFINEKDIIAYNNLEQKNLEYDATKAYQKRENVQKDLYIVDKNARKHYQISSKISEIFLDRKHQKYQLIENLNSITLICFEDILDPQIMQQIKYITAKSGSYMFPSHKFNLFDVNLSFINTHNFSNIYLNKKNLYHAIDKNAYFQGKAKELSFSIHKKKPEIKAISFVGSFNPKKSVR